MSLPSTAFLPLFVRSPLAPSEKLHFGELLSATADLLAGHPRKASVVHRRPQRHGRFGESRAVRAERRDPRGEGEGEERHDLGLGRVSGKRTGIGS